MSLFYLLALATVALAQEQQVKTLAAQFDSVNTLVKDNEIDKAQALKKLQDILPELQAAYNKLKPDEAKKEKWVFPIEGYSSKNIGGTRGEGYILSGYDYFDGNKHGGHPAHDIFIHDKNQDSKDEFYPKPVDTYQNLLQK